MGCRGFVGKRAKIWDFATAEKINFLSLFNYYDKNWKFLLDDLFCDAEVERIEKSIF